MCFSNTWCYSNERTATVALQVSSDITAGSMRPFYATNSNCERESHEKAATLMNIASFGSFCVGPCKFVLVPFFFPSRGVPDLMSGSVNPAAAPTASTLPWLSN